MDSPNPDLEILKELQNYGDRTSSFMTSFGHFEDFQSSDKNIPGRIRFVDTKKTWVAATEPITENSLKNQLCDQFKNSARQNKKTVLFSPIGENLAKQLSRKGYAVFPIGIEPTIHLHQYFHSKIDPALRSRSVRRLKRSQYSVIEVTQYDQKLDQQLKEMTTEWLKRKILPPLGFLNRIDPSHHQQYRRLFLLKKFDQIIGFASAVPIFKENGFYFADVILKRGNPHGTYELLLIEAMRKLYETGVSEVRLGLCPLTYREAIPSSSPLFWSPIASQLRKWAGFQRIYESKLSLNPTHWETLYLASDRKFTWSALQALVSAHLSESIPSLLAKITRKKIFRTWSQLSNYLRGSLNSKITLHPQPKTFTEWISRAQMTLGCVTVFLALHALRLNHPGLQSFFESIPFRPGQWTLEGVFLAPLFHNHGYHLFGDCSTFLLLVGAIEIFYGLRFAFILVGIGLWLSNPLTDLLVQSFLPLLNPEQYLSYLQNRDYGSSNAVYVAAGAVAGFFKKPAWILAPFLYNAIALGLAEKNWILIHHILALGMGFLLIQWQIKTSSPK